MVTKQDNTALMYLLRTTHYLFLYLRGYTRSVTCDAQEILVVINYIKLKAALQV